MTLLSEQHDGVVRVLREAFELVAGEDLGLPGLVIDKICMFVEPGVWQPTEEDWAA